MPTIGDKYLVDIDSDTAKSHFINYVAKKFCYGKVPSKDCEIIKTIKTQAFYVISNNKSIFKEK